MKRHLDLANVFNLRDAGGYAAGDGGEVRWKTLLRSGDLSRIDDNDRAAFDKLGLRTILDLRDADEAATAVDAIDGMGARLVSCPIFEGELPSADSVTLVDLYRFMVDQRGERLAAAIRALARPEALPALVHCTAGKDRTGVVTALMLTLAGVARDDIIADYSLSNRFLGSDFKEQVRKQLAGWNSDAAATAIALNLAVDSPPDAMRQTLDHIDREYGGTSSYLLAHDVTDDELTHVGHALVTGDH